MKEVKNGGMETNLASAEIRAQVCSVALMVFPPGVLEEGEGRGGEGRMMGKLYKIVVGGSHFSTVIPLSAAAVRSMLSTPVPALPTTFSLTPAASTSAVTLVPDLTINPSYSCT